ncbi:MAG: hypothetical protein K2V38_13610 [Gemmataceae bacterium]|nr:hypothetical protein [Gemmataceae bacterium]
MTDLELESLASQSPAGRDERTWLLVKDFMLRRLHELVPGDVQFGPYWIHNTTDDGGSLCSRVRCPFRLHFVPESDY